MDYDGLTIEGNRIADFTISGIAGPNNGTHRVLVRDNEIDGDPRFVAASRRPGGTWSSATGLVGVQLTAASGFVLSGNAFRNVGAAVNMGAATKNILAANTLHCDPVATGFSTANRGVGRVEPGGAGWLHVVETCDPADALFGRIKAATLFSSASQPAAGTYVAGHFVAASVPAVANRQALLGWLRLTTGSDHVAGTDWAAVLWRRRRGIAGGTARDRLHRRRHLDPRPPGHLCRGGGVGRAVAAAATARWPGRARAISGGGGGGGGGKRRARYLASQLPASLAVSVGAAGQPGVGAGGNGSAGGMTSFGTLLRAYGGGGGAGGSTAHAGGGGGAGDNNTGGSAIGAFGGAGGGAFGGVRRQQWRRGRGGPGGRRRRRRRQHRQSRLEWRLCRRGRRRRRRRRRRERGRGGARRRQFRHLQCVGLNPGGTAPGGSPPALEPFVYGQPASMGAGGGAAGTTGPGAAGGAGQTPGGRRRRRRGGAHRPAARPGRRRRRRAGAGVRMVNKPTAPAGGQQQQDRADMEPRNPRRTVSRADLGELGERVTRVETTAEHVQESLMRIDASLATMQQKIDSLATAVAQGVGGLRVGVVLSQAGAGVIGFLVARFWPVGK